LPVVLTCVMFGEGTCESRRPSAGGCGVSASGRPSTWCGGDTQGVMLDGRLLYSPVPVEMPAGDAAEVRRPLLCSGGEIDGFLLGGPPCIAGLVKVPRAGMLKPTGDSVVPRLA
jgi:hypothetical protein